MVSVSGITCSGTDLHVYGGDKAMRYATTLSTTNGLVISGSLNKNASCSDHFVVLTTGTTFSWSWASTSNQIKFVWNCDSKYIYSYLGGTPSTPCSTLADYAIKITISGSTVKFEDDRCTTLQVTDAMVNSASLYLWIGGDCDSCTAVWHSLTTN